MKGTVINEKWEYIKIPGEYNPERNKREREKTP